MGYDSGAKGRRFESCQAYQLKESLSDAGARRAMESSKCLSLILGFRRSLAPRIKGLPEFKSACLKNKWSQIPNPLA
jgi:hypothetical protein